MTREQDALFTVERPVGRHERLLLEALDAARAAQRIDELDGGLVSLALANANALDAAEATEKPYYPVAQLTAPYREVLQALRLTPADRESEADDALAAALDELSRATVRDA